MLSSRTTPTRAIANGAQPQVQTQQLSTNNSIDQPGRREAARRHGNRNDYGPRVYLPIWEDSVEQLV
jgi:hypothetical protein